MVYELLHNNRTIGADDPEVGEAVAKVYASFCRARSPSPISAPPR